MNCFLIFCLIGFVMLIAIFKLASLAKNNPAQAVQWFTIVKRLLNK